MLPDIVNHLAGHPWRHLIQYFDTIDSTNTYAKAAAAAGAPEGTVILSGHQTAGRGRMGRSFSSPAHMGIYLSVILRPNCPPEALMHLTCAAGLAASDAVTKVTGQTPGIKWTNDLILNRRKLGGILTELSIHPGTGLVEWAVIGIGINCCQTAADFPADIRDMAISLGFSRDQLPLLAAALIAELANMNRTMLTNKAALRHAFRLRCVTIGQAVSVVKGDSLRHGTAMDIDEDGGLVVKFADGTVETVQSGEVSIRGMYGYV